MRLQIRKWEKPMAYMSCYCINYDATLLPRGEAGCSTGAYSRITWRRCKGGCGFVKCTFQDPTTQNHESESLAVRSGNLPSDIPQVPEQLFCRVCLITIHLEASPHLKAKATLERFQKRNKMLGN